MISDDADDYQRVVEHGGISAEQLLEWKRVATRRASYIADGIEIDPLGHDYKDKRIVELIQALKKEREHSDLLVRGFKKCREDKKVLMEALRFIEFGGLLPDISMYRNKARDALERVKE